ncbi:DUF3368 domain-containing protein [candidate division KSB1 bacterium]|nr:DUF3368 domain-containing protein [candidate division KSB1 bacterium]MBL7095531.1 DUF3368 domain-containing protein [candidate division KSB1 bacterium]
MKVVSNSSVLISLSSINRLELLKDKFGEIQIPQAVWTEVVVAGEGEPGSIEVKNADWIEIVNVSDKNLVVALNEILDLGESEAIALALEIGTNVILIDEKDARLIATKYQLNPLGTVGILIWAKKNGKFNNLKEELDRLIIEGDFRISHQVYQYALEKVGESE